ncbi:MAG: PadR family transcriptional regulator [Bacteroidota bacterium]
MEETGLEEFEEAILLLVDILLGEAYAFWIAEESKSQTRQSIPRGSVYGALSRLSEKGFLKSEMTESSATRGGRLKRIYFITTAKGQVLAKARNFRLSLRGSYIPSLAGNFKTNYGC